MSSRFLFLAISVVLDLSSLIAFCSVSPSFLFLQGQSWYMLQLLMSFPCR